MKKYLDYENFCCIYSNLEDYSAVEGKEGGYLIQSIKNVFMQSDACTYELNVLIGQIRIETIRLVKGEEKKYKLDYKPNKNVTRQVIESKHNILYNVYFEEMNINVYVCYS